MKPGAGIQGAGLFAVLGLVGCDATVPRYTGQVVDAETGDGVAQAVVHVVTYHDDRHGADTTLADGAFAISIGSDGKAEGAVLVDGYLPRGFFVRSGEPARLEIVKLPAGADSVAARPVVLKHGGYFTTATRLDVEGLKPAASRREADLEFRLLADSSLATTALHGAGVRVHEGGPEPSSPYESSSLPCVAPESGYVASVVLKRPTLLFVRTRNGRYGKVRLGPRSFVPVSGALGPILTVWSNHGEGRAVCGPDPIGLPSAVERVLGQ